MEQIQIDKNKSNDLTIKAVRQVGNKREVGIRIGKSPMVFTQIEQYRNLVGFETLALMRKAYGLNINAIVDEDEGHLFSEFDYTSVMAELEQVKKERDDIREERDLFKKIALKVNFNDVDMNDLFVDRLDQFNQLGDVAKNAWIGYSYLADLAKNE